MRQHFIAAALLAVAGCTTSQVGVLPRQSTASNFTLELAVGTATVGNIDGSSTVGLNVVTTFRQSNGQNATLVNTPTLSGPATFNGQGSMTGVTPAQLAALAQGLASPAPNAGFGASIGAYGDGFAPLNLADSQFYTVAVTDAGTCDGLTDAGANDGIRYDALALPLAFPGCPTSQTGEPFTYFQYYGGPPAWPSPQGYGLPTITADGEYFRGYPLGFTDFYNVTPVPGTYSLGVAYAANPTDTKYVTVASSAMLASVAPLPEFEPPGVRVQPDGSAFVDVNVPAGVSEAIVLISTTACQTDANGNVLPTRYFSLLTRQDGPQTLFLSSSLGPPNAAGVPTDTFCTAADDALPSASGVHFYSAGAVGFDYPAFEASYPQSTTVAPVIANANGQADITTANPLVMVQYALTAPGSARHRFVRRR